MNLMSMYTMYRVPEKIQNTKSASEILKSSQIQKDYRGQRNEGRHAKVRLG